MAVAASTESQAKLDAAVRLRMAVGRLSRRLRSTRAGAALTSTETSVLAAVVRHGPIGLGALAAEEDLNPTMLSRVVRSLERSGLMERRADPGDRRAAVVEATDDGRRLHDLIRQERAEVLTAYLDRLAPKELQSLVEALPVLERLAGDLLGRRP